ncbi:hypothetical protein C8J57DRAFT_1234295 [Mycena rebaudengoi]|nr:hypothetical protein C8J57DRAFT_1234295 [Mycena rebaudengoi]
MSGSILTSNALVVEYDIPCSVLKLAVVPQAIRLILLSFLGPLPLSSNYSDREDGVFSYIEKVVAPFGQLINKAIPGSAASTLNIQSPVKVLLWEYVAMYLRYVSLTHIVALEIVQNYGTPYYIPAEAIFSLYLMQKFHRFLEHPSYGYGSDFEEDLLRRVDIMLRLARSSRKSINDPINVAPILGIAAVLTIPSWTVATIQILMVQEEVNPWIGEKYLLTECVQEADRVAKDLASAITDDIGAEWTECDFPETALNRNTSLYSSIVEIRIKRASFRMTTLPVLSSTLLQELWPILPVTDSPYMVGKLELLWVTHVRGLAQAIHEISSCRAVERIPPLVISDLRGAVKVLISNMILLGSTKVSASADQDSLEQYHIPGTCTLTFAMAENFVACFSFEGDEDSTGRLQVFEALSLLHRAMIIRRDFRHSSYNFLGYNVDTTDPSVYGVGQRTTRRLTASVRDGNLHNFGEGLARCSNPEDRVPVYNFREVPEDEKFVRTRSNTPEPTESVE